MKKIISTLFLCFSLTVLFCQSIGVRAGLNYSSFKGPLEPGEKFGYASGFHFGVNYGYRLTDKFMIRAELQYIQTGSKQTYDTTGYYLVYLNDGITTIYEPGKVNLNLDISNGFINLPIMAAYQVHPKLELFGGVSANFLINPIGRGTLRFESLTRPTKIVFRQTLDHNYYSDLVRGAALGSSRPIGIIVDDATVSIPKSVGAYYQDLIKNGSKYNWFDMQATIGANYFINKGFFVGLKYNYGLFDFTNNEMDKSLAKLNPDNTFIRRQDVDRNTGFEVSVGFRF